MAYILIIDDEPTVQDALRRMLEYANNSVDIASNYFEAVAMIKKNSYDLIIIDIVMTKKSGIKKPINSDILLQTVARATEVRQLGKENRRLQKETEKYQRNLEKMVEERTHLLEESRAKYSAKN
ncbi:MAG: hypothetical protein B6244_00385 [Candidatus Cloacimonetes bacterium 4572_55]|nr:MAG: hypothetical protein B6244_00385 [Candidatus Cloacimonetes bacterium 4572_55]